MIILYFGVSNKKKTFVVKIPNEILNESYLQDIADGKIFLTDRPSENYYYDIASKSVLKQDIPAKDYFIERIGTEDFAQLYRYKKNIKVLSRTITHSWWMPGMNVILT